MQLKSEANPLQKKPRISIVVSISFPKMVNEIPQGWRPK